MAHIIGQLLDVIVHLRSVRGNTVMLIGSDVAFPGASE